jgi:hypoxanthine phosphoribosyltransferase
MLQDISTVLPNADCLWTSDQLKSVYDELSSQISSDLSSHNPLMLCVMNGGLFLTAELLQRMEFLLELDYIHATRYQGKTEGGEMQWIRFPADKIQGRHVLIIDDILDIGITLKEIQSACHKAGAADVKSVVLTVKQHDRRIKDVASDYVGVEVEDRYVFGCGMDYKGYYRNLNAIYAVGES